MLRSWVELVIKRPWVTIFIILALTGVLTSHMGKLKMRLEPDQQLPPTHPLVKIGQTIVKEFGGKYFGVIVVQPKKGTVYTSKVFRKIKAITDRANQLKGLRPNGVVSVVADNFRDIRYAGGALEVKPYVDSIPQTEEEFAALRKRLEHNTAISRVYVNENGTSASITIDFEDFEAAGGSKGCQPSLERIAAPERDANTDITVTGMPQLVYWYMVYIERTNITFLFALLMIGWLQYRTFRTFQGMLIPLVTALLGVGWAMGMMGWTGADIDPFNSMIAVLVLAIAAGHSTQILKRYYEEYNRIRAENPGMTPKQANREAVVSATVKVGIVMLAAGGIAAISFASLVTFELPSVQTFGKGVAFGILASLLIEMSFIPALRSILPAPTEKQSVKEQSRTFFEPFLYWLADTIRNGRDRWIIPLALGLLAVAVAGALRMETNNNLDSQFFPGKDLWQRFQPGYHPLGLIDSNKLATQISVGTNELFIRFETPQPDGIKDPDVLRRIDQVQQFIKKRSAELSVKHVASIVDFLKLMNRAMNEDDPKAEVLPTTREAVAQYLFFASLSGPGGDIERVVDFDYQRAVMTIFLSNDDNRTVGHFINLVQREIDKAFKGSTAKAQIGGGITYLYALNDTIVRDKILNMAQMAVIIFLITTVLLRSLVGALMVLIPLICSVVINFGLMGWFDIWLSMGTATISSIAVGMGADYAIYFIFRMREEYARTGNKREAAAITMTTSGKAIVSVALAIATGYLCLVTSGNKIHFLMGTLVALMMVSSCLGAIALMPAIMVRIKASFLGRGGQPEVRPPNGEAGKSAKLVKGPGPIERPQPEASLE